ncbi:hypothetical protein [Vagococcus carniphilus]|nr:hypothetical protein [Vagococcus carniphilus]
MISLQPVTEENLDDIISLDVSSDQKEFSKQQIFDVSLMPTS